MKEEVAKGLASSHRSGRAAALKEIRHLLASNATKLDDDTKSQRHIAKLVLNTYNYYQDAASRTDVILTLLEYVAYDRQYLHLFAQYIHTIAAKCLNSAITNVLTLLSWTNHLLLICDLAPAEPAFTLLVESQMYLLYSASDRSTDISLRHNPSHRNRINKSCVAQTKRAVTKILLQKSDADTSAEVIRSLINTVLDAKYPCPSGTLAYIAVLANALHDLLPLHPHMYHTIESDERLQTSIMDFFVKNGLMAKAAPAPFAISAFTQHFIAFFVKPDTFESVVLPNLEKAIVRSSEVGLCHIAPYLFGVPRGLDISKSFAKSKLLTNILNGMKSPKEHVCQLSFTTMKYISHNCLPSILAQDTNYVIDQILSTLKSTTNTECRILLIKTINEIESTEAAVTEHILKVVQPLVAKEANELLLAELVNVFGEGFLRALKNGWTLADNDKIVAQIVAGFGSAKASFKSIWSGVIGQKLLEANSALQKELLQLFDKVQPTLQKSLAEAVKAPLPTVANKAILPAFVYIALLPVYGASETETTLIIVDSLKASDDKISILTSSKVATKLLDTEQFWCLQALVAAFPYLDKQDSFASVYLYLSSSTAVTQDTNAAAVRAIPTLLKFDEKKASGSLAESIKAMGFNNECANFNAPYGNVNPVLNQLTKIENKDAKIENLVLLFVVSHLKSLHIKDQWIGLVLRSELDPNDVVVAKLQELFAQAYETMRIADPGSELHAAASEAIKTMAFINAHVTQPIVASALKNDFNIEAINNLDETAVQIWKAQEGELVVDVLAASAPKPKGESKNSKDYETRKWEENLKKELSSKGRVAKKLTREEQALVNEQLSTELKTRAQIGAMLKLYSRAFSLVEALTEKSAILEGGCEWLSVAVFSALEVMKAPFSFDLFGESAARSFIRWSKVCFRLHPLTELAGAVTLRALDIKGVPENFCQLPLIDLISNVLFRTKMMVDDWFNTEGFIYIAPLITKVLQTGIVVAVKNSKKQVVTSEFADEDPEEEHLSLAISILSAQNMLQNNLIPREPILESLIELMRIPSKAKMAKECLLTLCQHISVDFCAADLQIFLRHIVTADTFVKTAILQGLDAEFDLSEDFKYADEIWIAMHDNDHIVSDTAQTIWQDNEFTLTSDALKTLFNFIDEPDSGLRLTIARAIATAAITLQESGTEVFDTVLDDLLALFIEKQTPPPAPRDKFGLVINNHASQRDHWEARSTLAITLRLLSLLCQSQRSIEKIFDFLVNKKTLGDKEPLVCQELLEAGIEIIRVSGADYVETLIPLFEEPLAAPDINSKTEDRIKESVIILYGALGRHLKKDDARLTLIFDRLLSTLDTPSEDVQHAISEGIAPLVPSFEDVLQDKFDELFEKLWSNKTLAVRKGAAYGIAGLVKGAHIKALFANDVMKNLITASDDKKVEAREGVAFLVDCLSQALGSQFEPYVIELLPVILKSLGDPSNSVREATDLAARQIMKCTTSYGVKQLIPLAIRNLDDIAWRTKKGSVELLGSMAYLDPTQLSASLSTIVPQIVGVLNDSHKEVRKASDQALKRFGEVIRNPEIQAIVPDLINAIGDPTKFTDEALDKLIKTQFVHYIDGPSLALIIHVIHRGMKDRSASTKKKACQIVGNMAILVDSHDLQPYLAALIAELEIAMVDPVPETRSTGARALGSLVEKLGEDRFPDMIPKLIRTLNDPSKAGDRLGSAQALSEVICGLGLSKLDEMLPSILTSAQSPYANVRAGFMPLLLYLPICFGSQFAPYLSRIIPPILQGLADTDEEIRDTALRAGRLIVKNYASKAVDLLLPELEQGLSDSSYRIRLSSVELTGDLLFQVTGISGKNELTEEQAEVNRNLVGILGQDRRDRILAALFVCRSDVTSVVRAAAIDIWKALVANTPKTIKEIIPSLTHILVRRLASSDDINKTIAAATLGDVVRRVGANALAQLLPALEELLVSSDTDAKLGICIALTELISSASSDALTSYQNTFINIVKEALVDASPSVREAAAKAFEALQDRLGKLVIDEVLPSLLNQLDSDDSENALHALQEIMATKADVIFPILIPTLMAPPIDVFKTKALSSLAAVAGPALYSRLASIINTLLQAIIDTERTGTEVEIAEVKAAFDKTLLSVEGDAGVHPVMQQLMSLIKHQDADKRAAIAERLGVFFEQTNLDYSIYVLDMMSQLIFYLGDKNPEVVTGVQSALAALVNAQDKSMLEKLVKPAHQALTIAGVRGTTLPGFELPKGPSCVLPIFSHGLMYGTSEQKVLSAMSIAEVIDRTPAANLKPFATPITGPLIRVIGERVSSDIKSAILGALISLLRKIPQFLRPFIPQLQRTFVRSLSDSTNESLRSGAVTALGILIEFQPRVDSLVTELVSGARGSDDQVIKNSFLNAMLQVVLKGGSNMSDASKVSIMTLVEEEISHVNDKSAVAYARLLGSLSQVLSAEEAANILKAKILSKRDTEEELKFGILSINSFLRDAPAHIFNTGLFQEIVNFVVFCAANASPYISDNATVAMGKILLLDQESKSPKQSDVASSTTTFEVPEKNKQQVLEQTCVNTLQPTSNSSDTRRLALVVIRTVSRKKNDSVVHPNLDMLAPTVFSCLRDSVIPIRLAAEKAFLALFNLVDDPESNMFNEWFAKASEGTIANPCGAVIQPRSIGDYTKRVASRLASVERERLSAGGDAETLYSDRIEDEDELWAVGGH